MCALDSLYINQLGVMVHAMYLYLHNLRSSHCIHILFRKRRNTRMTYICGNNNLRSGY